MNSSLSIAIVTKRRQGLLDLCLNSISQQSKAPNDIVVVDNDGVSQSARRVVEKWQSKLPVRYFLEKKEGAPNARNKALAVCSTKYLGFVDDDCVLDPSWLKEASRSISKFPDSVFFQGRSVLANFNDLVATAEDFHIQFWRERRIRQSGKYDTLSEIDPLLIDTKNIVINVKKIREKSIFFDPMFHTMTIDAADTDFGFQLQKSGCKGVLLKKLLVSHVEESNLLRVLQKTFARGHFSLLFEKKWGISPKETGVGMAEATLLDLLFSCRNWGAKHRFYFRNYDIKNSIKLSIFVTLVLKEYVQLLGYYSSRLGRVEIMT